MSSTTARGRCIELASAYNEAWKISDLDAVMRLHAADGVFHLHAMGQSPAVGAAAVRTAFEASMAMFSDMQAEVRRVNVGDDFWVAEITMRGKLGEGAAIEMYGVDVITVRDGLVARKDSYFDTGPVAALMSGGGSTASSQVDTRAAVLVDFFQRGWSLPKPEGFTRHFRPWIHPDIVATQPMMPAVQGRAAFEQMFTQVFALLPDFSLTVLGWAAQGDWIHIRSRCRCSVGVRQLEFEVSDVLRLSNGLMIERHAYFDPSAMQKAILLQPHLWPRAIASLRGKSGGTRSAAASNAGNSARDKETADRAFKWGRFVGLGALIWLIAALFIRFTGAGALQGGPWSTGLLFAATFPLSWISIRLCISLGRARTSHAVPAVATMSVAALLLDGVAFTWFPQLYGNELRTNLMSAAWLLWAVGAFLATAFLVGGNTPHGQD